LYICAFKGKDFDIVDDRIFVYGTKQGLNIDLTELNKQIKKEKTNFIDWF